MAPTVNHGIPRWQSNIRYWFCGPRNRFAGIRPSKRIGQITLKTVNLDGVKRIEVNGDASKGSIRVEVLNDSGYRIKVSPRPIQFQ